MWPAEVLQFSPHCLFYYWWERERLRSAVYHIYSKRCEDTREEHHATGNTANLRENILWELSVNTSIQCGFYENISQTVDAWLEDDPVWLYPPPPSAQSCCPCRLLHYRCPCVCGHINLLVSWGPHKDRQSGCLFVDIIGLNISLFLIVLRVYIYIFTHWVVTERWHGQASACFLQAAGAVWLLMQSSKEFTNCIPPALCTEPCLMREYGSCN